MNCQTFLELWQQRLDARSAATLVHDPALRSHAACCPSCQALANRLHNLEMALDSMSRRPATSPPPELAQRVLAEVCSAAPSRSRSPAPILLRFWRPAAAAAAAALFLAASLFWLLLPAPAPQPTTAPAPSSANPVMADAPNQPMIRPLSSSLADVSSAARQLAKATGEPAARLGRQVLLAARSPAPTPEAESPVPSPSLISSVTESVQQSVRPLSGSARHAFSFLLPATPEEKPQPATPPRRGA